MLSRFRLATSDGVSVRSEKSTHTMNSENIDLPPEKSAAPSLLGLLASKRFVNKLHKKVESNKQYKQTYQMEPKSKVSPTKIYETIENVMTERLAGLSYNPKFAGRISVSLAEQIKRAIWDFIPERYRVIITVSLGELKDQGLQMASRCSWNHAVDDYICYNFRSPQMFCVATAYFIYKE